MKKLLLIAASIMAWVVWAEPKQDTFKVNLAGVAVCGMNESVRYTKPLPPETQITVPPGKIAVFFVEYDFPTDQKSRLFLTPNTTLNIPFGYSGSGAYSGKGRVQPVLFLPETHYGEPFLLKSVRFEGEIVAQKGEPRNQPFFIKDIPVEVLFAKETEPDTARVIPLTPASTP